jgi:hypothetical protein
VAYDDDFFSREDRYAIDVETNSGLHYLAIPVEFADLTGTCAVVRKRPPPVDANPISCETACD